MDAASSLKLPGRHREETGDSSCHPVRGSRLRCVFLLLCLLTSGVVLSMLLASVSKVKVIRLKLLKSEVSLRFGSGPDYTTDDISDEAMSQGNAEVLQQGIADTRVSTPASHKPSPAKPAAKDSGKTKSTPKDTAHQGKSPDSHSKDAAKTDTGPKVKPEKAKPTTASPSKAEDAKKKGETSKAEESKDATRKATSEKAPTPPAVKAKGPRKRYIIFQCDHTRWCGGLGDRQRGLISTFVLAHILNRTYGLNITTPCNINQFVRPNEVAWDLDPAELAGLSERTLDTFGKNELYPAIINGTVDSVFPEDVLRIKTNGDLLNQILRSPRLTKLLPEWARTSESSRREGWRRLVRYTDHIRAHYRDLFKAVRGPEDDKDLICAHVRLARNPTMPNDGDSRFLLRDMEKLWTFVEPYVANGTHFFLATDAEQVRNIARARFEKMLIDTNGKILHIDRQRGNREACNAFELAILEQYILSHCRTLIISPSNFSHRAREFRGKGDVYIFTRKGIAKT